MTVSRPFRVDAGYLAIRLFGDQVIWRSSLFGTAMTALQVEILKTTCAIMIVIFCAYVGGRLHQWYRHSTERDQAFREGYHNASVTLFPIAARSAQSVRRHSPPALDETVIDLPPAGGRERVGDLGGPPPRCLPRL